MDTVLLISYLRAQMVRIIFVFLTAKIRAADDCQGGENRPADNHRTHVSFVSGQLQDLAGLVNLSRHKTTPGIQAGCSCL